MAFEQRNVEIRPPKGIMQGCKLALREGYPGIKRKMKDIESASTGYVKTRGVYPLRTLLAFSRPSSPSSIELRLTCW